VAILNYRTEIKAEVTVAEIQRMLARAGARSILIDYDSDGEPSRVSFLVKSARGNLGFQLPANADAVFTVMAKQASEGKMRRSSATRSQAARVAWRIVKDWLEAQLAIIEAEMAVLEQVFLPYMTVQNKDGEQQSLFQLMQAQHFEVPLLEGPKEEG
jgi:hypothetical protein